MPFRRLGLTALIFPLLAVPAAAQNRITGGEVTKRDWPHMAAMEYKAPGQSTFRFICGASLVAPDVILTASHCIDDGEKAGGPDTVAPETLRFLIGTKKRSAGGERIAATKVIEHPDYNGNTSDGSDVALIKLERSSTLGKPINLAVDADKPQWEPGDDATVTGWGSNNFLIGSTSDDLQEVTVPIVSDDQCETSYEPTLGFDRDTTVCAGNTQGGEDSCQGDSGGPLMVQNTAKAWVQIGVVSYGLGCGYPAQYGAYAEVGAGTLRTWVKENTAKLSTATTTTTTTGTTGSTTPSGGSTAPATEPAPQPAPAPAPAATVRSASPALTKLVLSRRIGSARYSRRLGRVLAGYLATRPLRSVKVTLRQRGRTVASVRKASIKRGGQLRLKLRKSLRPGAAALTLTGRDDLGRPVRMTRRVTLKR